MTRPDGQVERGRNNLVVLLMAAAAGILVALLTMMAASAPQAQAAAPRVGPISADNGFPLWYQDANGRRLDLCLDEGVDAGGLCLTGLNDPNAPPTLDNFGDVEAFWWAGNASIERRAGGQALLVLAAEAAFLNDAAVDGDQISFGRVRVRIDNLRINTAYTITYPYGRMRLRSDGAGVINVTRDIGCAATPCNFGLARRSPVFQSFLRWDPRFGRRAPAGHLGDPAIEHRVVGSPFDSDAARRGLQPANFFQIEGPDAGGRGTGIDRVQTSLFSIQGRLAN